MEIKDQIELIKTISDSLDQKQKLLLDQEDMYGNTPLTHCLIHGLVESAKEILNQGIFDKNRVDEGTNLTPLHKAATITDEGLLELLISNFKNAISKQDIHGNTPLHYAAWYRNKNFIDILVQNGASTKIQNKDGNTPLHLACAVNNPLLDHSSKVEELLLDNKSDVNAINLEKKTPMMLLFFYENEDETISKKNKFDPISTIMIFLKRKSSIKLNHVDGYGRNLLHYACIRGSTISALTLINEGVDCNLEDYSGTTPFGYAIKNRHEDLCIFIMQNKGFKVPKSIPRYSISKESPYVGLNFLLNNVVSLSEFELLKERKKLSLSSEKVKFEKGYSTQESHSPIYIIF